MVDSLLDPAGHVRAETAHVGTAIAHATTASVRTVGSLERTRTNVRVAMTAPVGINAVMVMRARVATARPVGISAVMVMRARVAMAGSLVTRVVMAIARSVARGRPQRPTDWGGAAREAEGEVIAADATESSPRLNACSTSFDQCAASTRTHRFPTR